jgi:formylglycine-generating enzyme required for sulfatase activity
MHNQRTYRVTIGTLWPVPLVAWGLFLAGTESSAQKEKDDRPPVVNSLGMRLVLIPRGDFTMGSEEFPSEKPPRPARITREFYLAIHHVTVGQFRTFVKDAGYQTDAEKGGGAEGFDASIPWVAGKPGYSWNNPGFEQGDDHPVVCVSWNDAVAFCQWLGKKEGRTYRLPTDRELEYAIRAGTRTHWSCGDTPESLKGFANCADLSLVQKGKLDQAKLTERNRGLSPASSGIATWEDGYAFTSPVGAFKPNPWGLYDMHGNAWQWCLDLMVSNRPTKDPLLEPEDVTALAKGTGNRKIRGGSWWLGPGRCRSANWANRAQSGSFAYIGFRVARAAD